MKRTLSSFIAAFVVVLAICSCQKAAYINCSTTSLTFESDGGTGDVSFSTNADWIVSASQSWCHCTPSNGVSSFLVTCDANTSYDDRSCTITITAETVSHVISVTQSAKGTFIIGTTEYDLSNEEHTVTVEIKHNVEYEVVSQVDWVTVVSTKAMTASQITLKVQANTAYDAREGKVTVSANKGALSQVITIKQSESSGLKVSQDKFSLTSDEQEFGFNVQYNVDYDIVIPEDASEWLLETTVKGLAEKEHTFLVKENTGDDRQTDITVKQKDGSMCATVRVEQKHKKRYELLSSKEFANITEYIEGVERIEELSPLVKAVVMTYVYKYFEIGTEKMRFYVLSYPSVDPFGNSATLSTAVMIPDKAFTEERKVDGVVLSSHFTVMRYNQCPTLSNNIEGVFAWKNHIVVLPDNYGMGISTDQFQCYHHRENTPRTNIDALLAAQEFIEDSGLDVEQRIINLGYSQGGYGAIVNERYVSEHPELGISFTKTFAGGGAYNIKPNFEDLAEQGRSDALSLVILAIMSMKEYQTEGIDYSQVFKGPLLSNYKEWYFSKKYSASEVDELLGTDKAADVFSDELMSGESTVYDKFMKAADNNSLTEGDWKPADGSNIYLYHSTEDNLVPYKNYELLKAMFDANPGNYNVYYNTSTGTHQDGYITFMLSTVLANWQ